MKNPLHWLLGLSAPQEDLAAFKPRVERALNRKELLNLYFQLLDLYRAKFRGTNRAMNAYAVVRYVEQRLDGGDARDDARLVLELANHPAAPATYKEHGAEWLSRQTLRLNLDTALALTSALKTAAENASSTPAPQPL